MAAPQIQQCVTALQQLEATTAAVMEERSGLVARIATVVNENSSGSGRDRTGAPAAPQANEPGPNSQAVMLSAAADAGQQQQQSGANNHGLTASRPLVTVPGVCGGDGGGLLRDTVSELEKLTALLSSNVARERSAHNTVSDFLCTRCVSDHDFGTRLRS
jgi:hypothetical protein